MPRPSGMAGDIERSADRPAHECGAPESASIGRGLSARQVVVAHYAWLARAQRREARIAEAWALGEIGGDDRAPETAGRPASEPAGLIAEPTPAPWRAAPLRALRRIGARTRTRLREALLPRSPSPVSSQADFGDSPIAPPLLRE